MEAKKKLLTYAGLKALEDELENLKVVKRREIAQKIKEAREQGDLSENAEYDAAKDEQRDIELRIEEIEKILKNAEVVVEDEVDEGKINVVGLDEGTYILKEVKPAPGYNNSAKDGVTFTIKRDSNDQLYQAGQSVTPSTESVISAASGVVKDGTAAAATGKLSFTIIDQKGSNLPLTGLNGVTFTWIAGGAVLCIGVAHLIRSRKQAEESEKE